MAWQGIPDRRTASARTEAVCADVVPGSPRLLRPRGKPTATSDRVLGNADDVLSAPVPRDALAQRFYDSVCLIADPLSPVPGPRESIQMLNTMESMSVASGMDDEQRTRFAEGMARRVEEARQHG